MSLRIGSLIAALQNQWLAEGIPARAGVGLDAIRAFEDVYNTGLCDDLAQYFQRIDGMPDDAMDRHMIRFWPLGEVRPVHTLLADLDERAHAGYFVIADFSILAHAYAIKLSHATDHPVAAVGGKAPIAVATSFATFLEKYLYDPISLFRVDSP